MTSNPPATDDDERRSGRPLNLDEPPPATLRGRLEQIEHNSQSRIDRWGKRLVAILIALSLATSVIGYVSVHLTSRVDDSQHRLRVAQSDLRMAQAAIAKVVAANRQAVAAIQQSRIDITYEQCKETNAKHDAVIVQLDIELLQGLKVHVDRKRLAEEKPSRQFTDLEQLLRQSAATAGQVGDVLIIQQHAIVRLLDALAPHQSCSALLQHRFGITKPS